MYLLNTLESEIIPLYYENRRGDFNPEWVKKIKASIALISRQFNTCRMVQEYYNVMFCPSFLQYEQMRKDNNADLKALVAWRESLAERFNTVKIKAILVSGIRNGKVAADGLIKVKLLLFSGKFTARELKAELILMRTQTIESKSEHTIIPLRRADARESGIITYLADYHVEDAGFYSYGIRVVPYNSMLFRQQDVGVVYWG